MFPLLDRDSFARPDVPALAEHGGGSGGPFGATAALVSRTRAPAGDGRGTALDDALDVLVVDADPDRGDVMARSLAAAGAGSVHRASSARQARIQAMTGPPCRLAVIHLELPDVDALDLVGELSAQGWRTVVRGATDDPDDARAAFRAGALAYFLTTAGDRRARVLEAATHPGPTGPNGPTPPHQASPVTDVDGEACELSHREVQVLQAVADGNSNAAAGQALALSALTVKSHLSRIGRKLGTGDRARMVVLAMRAGVVH